MTPGFFRLLLDKGVALDPGELSDEAAEFQPSLLEQKALVSGRISETTRTLAFGSLASCYALLVANKDMATLFADARPLLLGSAGFGIAAIIVDAVQYLLGYINVQQALASPEQAYPENWARQGRSACFVLKQFLAYVGALLLLAAVASILL